MKTIARLSASIIAVFVISASVYADVTLKVRQTMGGNQFESSTFIKGKRERTEQDFGGMKMVTIRQCDLKRTIKLNPMTQMYIVDSWAANESMDQTVTSTRGPSGDVVTTIVKTGGVVTVTITMRDTGERKKMFGYNARHVIVTTEMQSSADSCGGENYMKTETDGWYIDADFAFECGDNPQFDTPDRMPGKRKSECKDRYNVKTVGGGKLGYPVYEKMTMFDKAGKPSMTMVKEVYELSSATLDPALFEAPAGWRQAGDETEMFSGGMMNPGNRQEEPDDEDSQPSTQPSNRAGGESEIDRMIGSVRAASSASEKPDGRIRIGLAGVKSGSVGDGMNPEVLAGAIQNLFGDYFVGTGVEIVLLEAKLPAAIENEARESSCDFVLVATISHKRGGGGFGALRAIGSAVGRNIPYGGSVAEQVGSEVARAAVYTATDAAASIKAKDELTLDINLKKIDGSGALTRQFKSKATSERENIMSPVVEKATQAIVDFVTK